VDMPSFSAITSASCFWVIVFPRLKLLMKKAPRLR
jgi:hypothetical protein